MHTRSLIVAALCVVMLPLSVNAADSVLLQQLFAQLQALQSSITKGVQPSAPTQSSSCSVFLRTLRPGSSGEDVTRLQQYLASDSALYPEGQITGYYGGLTVGAVRRFQVLHGIVSDGTPETTGFGLVGTKTRAVLNTLLCSPEITTTTTLPVPATPHAESNSPEGNSILPQLDATSSAPAALATNAPQTNSPEVHSIVPKPVSIQVNTSGAGKNIALGTGMSIVWTASNAPAEASARVVLVQPPSSNIGTIVSGKPASGSMFWTLPQPPAACTGTATACLAQLANECNGELCKIDAGTYAIRVEIVQGGTVVARGDSASFTIGDTSAVVNTNGGDALAQLFALTPSVSVPITSSALDGLSQSVLSLLSALDGSATSFAPQPHISPPVAPTTPLTNGACLTPWGDQRVASGQQTTYQPFFTGGVYTGSKVNVLVQCTNGQWKKCDFIGDHCMPLSI